MQDIKTKRKVTNTAKKCKIVPVNNKFNIKVKFLSKRRRFSCDQCSKQLTTFSSLVIHKRTHSGEKPFACDLCPAKFTSNSNIVGHKKMHSMLGALYVYHERKKRRVGNSFISEESLTSANSQLVNKNSLQTTSGSSFPEREIGNADVLERIASSSPGKKFASSPREKKIASSSPAKKIASSSPAKKIASSYPDKKIASSSLAKKIASSYPDKKIASSYPDKKIIGSDSKKRNTGKSLEKEKNIYSCTECNKTFSWLASLLYHMRIHTGEMTYDCKKCKQKFSSMSDLFMHKKTHICGKNEDGSQFTEERIMPPPSSPLVHKTNNCLEKVERRSVVETEFDKKLCMQDGADENESYSCSQCNKQFQKKHGLKIHMYQAHRRKTENESYSCSQCNRQFPKKHGLKIHMYQAHQRKKILPPLHPGMKKSIKRFNCDLCCKKFSYESAVHIHKKYIHKLELNADKCEVQEEDVSLGISGKAKTCKKIKMRAEAKIGSHECDKCKKRFNSSGSLKGHMRLMGCHSDTSLYKCKKCRSAFLNPVYLRWHKCKDSNIAREKCNSEDFVISVNDQTAENTFDCEHCDKQFISARHLKSHLRVHAGEKSFSCSICNMKFTKAGKLRSHEKRKHSIWKSQILDHMPEKINVRSCDGRFECLECHKKFKTIGLLNGHSAVHTGIKAYKCDICERKFAFQTNLCRHKREDHSITKPRSGCQRGIKPAKKISPDEELHGEDPNQIRHSIRKKENFYNSQIRIESVFGSYQDWKTEEPREQLRLDSNSQFVCVRCSRDFPCVSSLEEHSKSCVFGSDDRPLNFEEIVKQEVEDDGPSAFLDVRSNAIPYYCDHSSIKTDTDDRDSGISVGHHQNMTPSLCDRSSVDTVMDDRDPQISVGDLVMKQEIEEAPLWKPYGCGKCCASYATKEEAVDCFRLHGDD